MRGLGNTPLLLRKLMRVEMSKEKVIETLHQALVNSLDEAPVEEVEILGQVLGQVALGEIKVKDD